MTDSGANLTQVFFLMADEAGLLMKIPPPAQESDGDGLAKGEASVSFPCGTAREAIRVRYETKVETVVRCHLPLELGQIRGIPPSPETSVFETTLSVAIKCKESKEGITN
jgi:hypothetical protein